jgi:hypothetical protein
MRRLIIQEPPARSALWCRRIGVFAALLAVMAVLASRLHVMEPLGAVTVLGVAMVLAGLALLMALTAAIVIWRTGHPGIAATLAGAGLGLLVLAYPAYLAKKAARLPEISDITTDPDHELAFSHAPAAISVRGLVQHAGSTPALRTLQAKAYPDLRALTLDASAADAQRAALKLVKKRRWQLVEAQAPSVRQPIGHIEAVAHSLVMGFPEDVVIRITSVGTSQSQVDMRSASRWGHRDFGSNAARIEAFLSDLEDTVDEE